MLFHRDFLGYTGGHGKVWDYFRHALALGWDARVHLTPASLRDGSNPWMSLPERIEREWNPDAFDLLFLAGMDWMALSGRRNPPRPVINLIQHVRHGWAGHPLRAFLGAPAHRICVSHPVAESILATDEVNGPVTVIPAALDLPENLVARSSREEVGRVLIAGLKAPGLARALAEELHLRGMRVDVCDEWIPRLEYLEKVAAAAVVVTLPHAAEGFYLPALEAMALGVPVVMTDCIGSREYARDGGNCILSVAEPQALAHAVEHAVLPGIAAHLRRGGRETAGAYGQANERERFAQVMKNMENNEP
ncbi:glycosyltransferase [Stenotrophomonas nitritireducens]|uniref:glycosyltransferase n=1 Tax=Stenotrophomonas nitritireducens TaxID=83617 RepID=UPI003D965F21